MDVKKIREDFPLLKKQHAGKPIVYFDNAATSLKPQQVIDSLNYYYTNLSANVHRGAHRLSSEASRLFEGSHKKVGDFIGAKETEIVFTRNTTESINLLAYSLIEQGFFKEGDEILVTEMEHHSNLVPWQFVERKTGARLVFARLNKDYTLDMKDLESKVSKKTKLVSVAHASNTVAAITPVKEIGKLAHDAGALFAIDAAQSAPHTPLDAKKIGCDFMCFSAHKMLGPTGVGVFHAREDALRKMPPFLYGGGMIGSTSWHSSTWNNRLPEKFEAGTPDIAGGIAFAAAIDYLKKIGMDAIEERGRHLTSYAIEKMSLIDGVKLHCPMDAKKQESIVLFEAGRMSAHDAALALDEYANIEIRSGMHCAEPLIKKINPEGLARASFYFYNTKEEIDIFTNALEEILKTFG